MYIHRPEQTKKAVNAELGDIVLAKYGTYMVTYIKHTQQFVLLNITNGNYANGEHSTMDQLSKSIEHDGFEHYSRSEYDLQLVRKGSNL